MTRATRRFARDPLTTVLSYAVAGFALIASVVILGAEIGRHVARLEAWVGSLGPWAIVEFVPLYALLSSVFVPNTLLGIVAGASFGFPLGLAAVVGGSLSGAALQYALARSLLKPVIDRAIASRPALTAIQSAVLEQELRLQLLIRLTPLNRAATSYVFGTAGVRFLGFIAAGIGLLPSLCLEVYFGYAGKHFAKVAGGSGHAAGVHEVVLVLGLVVAIVVMVVVSKAANRAVEAATQASAKPTSEGTSAGAGAAGH